MAKKSKPAGAEPGKAVTQLSAANANLGTVDAGTVQGGAAAVSGTTTQDPGAGGATQAASTVSAADTTVASETTKRKPKADERREFEVISPLKHDGGTYEIGDPVELTRAQFVALKTYGVVTGDWPED